MLRSIATPRPKRKPTPGDGGVLLLMFMAALALRAAYAWLATGPHGLPYGDAVDYDTLAWRLATQHGFTLGPDASPYPTAFRPPLLPWLVSLLYRVVGHRFFAAVLLQCVIGACVPVLLVEFGRQWTNRAVGLLAGWLATVHPLLVFFSGYLLTETAFVVMLLLAMIASLGWIKTPRPGRALGAGLLWGLAALTRPTALLMPLLVAAWAWRPLGLIVLPRDRWRQLLMLMLGVALAIAPWTLRNAIALNAFVPVTTGGGKALLDSNNPIVWDDPALRGGATSVVRLEPYATALRGLDEPAADARAGRLAREFLGQRVGDWGGMALAKLARFWRLNGETASSGSWRRSGTLLDRVAAVSDPLRLWSLLTWPFALWGLVAIVRGPRAWYQSLVPLTVLYFTALAVVYWGALRTRMPAEPMIVMLSAAGLDAAWRRLRMRRAGIELVERAQR